MQYLSSLICLTPTCKIVSERPKCGNAKASTSSAISSLEKYVPKKLLQISAMALILRISQCCQKLRKSFLSIPLPPTTMKTHLQQGYQKARRLSSVVFIDFTHVPRPAKERSYSASLPTGLGSSARSCGAHVHGFPQFMLSPGRQTGALCV